jgi:hypothetical protein
MSLHLTGDAAWSDGGTFVRRPVLSLSFALNHALLGHAAWTYQLGNVLVHLAAGLALFGVCRRTLRLGRVVPAARVDGVALAIALVWLVHPLHTESVAFLAQRAESLLGLCTLVSLYCAIRSWPDAAGEPAPPAQGTTRGWAAASVGAAALAMATKEVAVVVPRRPAGRDADGCRPRFRSAPLGCLRRLAAARPAPVPAPRVLAGRAASLRLQLRLLL